MHTPCLICDITRDLQWIRADPLAQNTKVVRPPPLVTSQKASFARWSVNTSRFKMHPFVMSQAGGFRFIMTCWCSRCEVDAPPLWSHKWTLPLVMPQVDAQPLRWLVTASQLDMRWNISIFSKLETETDNNYENVNSEKNQRDHGDFVNTCKLSHPLLLPRQRENHWPSDSLKCQSRPLASVNRISTNDRVIMTLCTPDQIPWN